MISKIFSNPIDSVILSCACPGIVGWAQCPALRGLCITTLPSTSKRDWHCRARHLSAWSPHPTQHSPALVMGQSTGRTSQDLTADKSFLGPGCQESLWQSQDHSAEYRNPGEVSPSHSPSVGTATSPQTEHWLLSNTRERPAHLTRRVKKSLLSPSCLWGGAVAPFPRSRSHGSDRASALMAELDLPLWGTHQNQQQLSKGRTSP